MILNFLDVEEVITDLKQDLFANGIPYLRDVRPIGGDLMVTCPYHGEGVENKPSMGITTIEKNKEGNTYPKGTCHCFTCNTTVDLTTLISDVFGYADGGMYGIKWLTKKYAFYTEENRKPIRIGPQQQEELKIEYVPEENYLPYTGVDIPYMYNRGISKGVLEYFQIGYNAQTREVIFPVMDPEGRCLLLQRRHTQIKMFNNDNVPYKGLTLYGYDKIVDHLEQGSQFDLSTLYVVESAIDALYLWTHGKPAVALLQAVPTKQQIELLKKLPILKIVAAQDNDKAGTLGAWLLKKYLFKSKLITRVIFPNDSNVKDINDLSSLQIQELCSTIVFTRPEEKGERYGKKQ